MSGLCIFLSLKLQLYSSIFKLGLIVIAYSSIKPDLSHDSYFMDDLYKGIESLLSLFNDLYELFFHMK